MIPERCERQMVEILGALDMLGFGASPTACYLAMAIDSLATANALNDDRLDSPGSPSG
jgi:hypothetical protein